MGSHFSAVQTACYNQQTYATISGTVFPVDRVGISWLPFQSSVLFPQTEAIARL